MDRVTHWRPPWTTRCSKEAWTLEATHIRTREAISGSLSALKQTQRAIFPRLNTASSATASSLGSSRFAWQVDGRWRFSELDQLAGATPARTGDRPLQHPQRRR
jgi:hypothetical protein